MYRHMEIYGMSQFTGPVPLLPGFPYQEVIDLYGLSNSAIVR